MNGFWHDKKPFPWDSFNHNPISISNIPISEKLSIDLELKATSIQRVSKMTQEIGSKMKTELYCHECDGHFIADINYGISGNHVMICPTCSHEHCRIIKDGIVTGDRWDGRNDSRVEVQRHNIIKLDKNIGTTISESHFLRELWINRL